MIELLDDPTRFARRAGPLIESTVHNTVLGTVLHGILAGRDPAPAPRFAIITDPAGEVTGAVLRTPPQPLTCSELAPGDAAALLERWLDVDPELATVSAAVTTARALGDAWTALTGGATEVITHMALHAVERDELREPRRPAGGRLRAPRDGERELCLSWEQAFAVESGVEADPAAVRLRATARIEDGREYIWDDGRPVCLLGHTPMIAEVPRIGPVYTPPELRGRGYGGAAVAALSRRLLDGAARRVVLFTDLENPTSNKIYGEVGYRRVLDWEQRRLIR